jgi:N-acetylglucosaminyldiphosphoundecaprenol N-acetyl-beta-D-mannosaminyltransferase
VGFIQVWKKDQNIIMVNSMDSIPVLGVPINLTSYDASLVNIIKWSKESQSRIIYAANVHMVMEAYDHEDFKIILQTSDIVTPDGMPLVWMLRLKGAKGQKRVYGPTLMLHVLNRAEKEHLPVGFYGANEQTLENLLLRIRKQYPNLHVAYSFSPPFRSLDKQESAKIIEEIVSAGVRILFVGLGCPKQEKWIAENKGIIHAVMLGVGAAFDIHAGVKHQAPPWLQRLGLEWLFRLTQEPNRLWRRYFYNNPRFLFLAIMDLLGIYPRR